MSESVVIPESVVEAAAEAMYREDGHEDHMWSSDYEDEGVRNWYRNMARAALAAALSVLNNAGVPVLLAEPTAQEMVHDLHRALYGDSWARPESPQQVWSMLLEKVRGLTEGRCWKCMEREWLPEEEQ